MENIIKRLMENHRLNEMALEKSLVEKKVESKGEDICTHIIKSVVYKNTTNDLYHWLHAELSSKFYYISNLDTKTKSGKLKEKAYKDLIFKHAGETEQDSRANLIGFRIDYVQSNRDPYPDFEITKELVKELRNTTDNIRDTICPLLAKKEHYTQEDMYEILKRIIEY